MIWRRGLLLCLVTITGLALETSVFGSITLLGTKPQLLLLITIALAMGEGAAMGAFAGFTMGLATDLVLSTPQGLSALTFAIAGYTVGRVRATFQTPVAWLPIAMVTITTFASVLFYASFAIVLGQASLPLLRILRHAAMASAYNGLLTPFLYPMIRGLAARLRPRAAGVMR